MALSASTHIHLISNFTEKLGFQCITFIVFLINTVLARGFVKKMLTWQKVLEFKTATSHRPSFSANHQLQRFKAKLRERELLSVLIYRAAAVSTPTPLLHFCLSPTPLSADVSSYCSLKFSRCRLHRLQGHLSFLRPRGEEVTWLRATGHL